MNGAWKSPQVCLRTDWSNLREFYCRLLLVRSSVNYWRYHRYRLWESSCDKICELCTKQWTWLSRGYAVAHVSIEQNSKDPRRDFKIRATNCSATATKEQRIMLGYYRYILYKWAFGRISRKLSFSAIDIRTRNLGSTRDAIAYSMGWVEFSRRRRLHVWATTCIYCCHE